MSEEMIEEKKVISESSDDTKKTDDKESDIKESSETIEDTRTQLADAYLTFLDQQKGGAPAMMAGINMDNPLKTAAKEYLLGDIPAKAKKKANIFDTLISNVEKNVKKHMRKKSAEIIEKVPGGTMLAYDKIRLDAMKQRIIQNKDNQTELKKLIDTIVIDKIDPTLNENDVAKPIDKTVVTPIIPVVTPEKLNTNKPYIFPLAGDIVTSPKGPRRGTEHNGIDIGGSNTDIKSIGDGVVESVGFGGKKGFSGYGNYVLVKLISGIRVLFGHLKKLSPLKVGEEVIAGKTTIGIMGSTGISTGNHLHLEIRKGTPDDKVNFFTREVIDPLAVIPVDKKEVSRDVLARIDQKLLENGDNKMVA